MLTSWRILQNVVRDSSISLDHIIVSITGHAFFQRKEGVVRVPVKSKVVVDAQQFRKSNPNYPRLFAQSSCSTGDTLFGFTSATDQADSKRVKSVSVTQSGLSDNDLLICSPTVLAFSLSDKFWGEAVASLIYDPADTLK